jgi:cAMP-dependent protein kinase regulator
LLHCPHSPSPYLQGEEGNAFYIVESGQLAAFKDGNPNPVMAYGPGDYFGELSLLGGDHQRAATVRARTDATLLVLDREGFRRLLGPLLPQLQEFAKTYTGHRTRLGKVRTTRCPACSESNMITHG